MKIEVKKQVNKNNFLDYDRHCFFYYNNAIDGMNKASIIAINSIWLFVKEFINAAYDKQYEEKSYENVDIINDNIHHIALRDMLHMVRITRNNYEHNRLIECSLEEIESWRSTLRLLIKHVNTTTKTGYQFKLKEADIIQTKTTNNEITISLNDNLAKTKGKIIDCDTEVIKNDKAEQKQQHIKHRQSKMIDTYYVAYGDSDKSFSITGNFAFDNKFPVFSVAHNLITRGKTISETDYLKSKKLSPEELETVYILEVIMLRAICEGLCDDGTLYVSSKHKELANIALDDIKYLCHLLGKMSNQTVDFPTIQFTEFENEFEAGRTYPNVGRNIIAKTNDYETDSFYMPKLFSTHIDYKITRRTIKYFCTILKLLFGYDEFREGQLVALQSIFDVETSHMIILPTGYGKSLIYQFYAFIQPQVTIVVSPTDSLIYDQIINLKTFGLTEAAQFDKHDSVKGYSYQLLSNLIYATPDVLESENAFSLINGLNKRNLLNTIAIDESHQVSVWGHCFDANYFTLLHQIKNEFKSARFLLFSATASQRIKEDLEQQFKPFELEILQPCPLVRQHIHYDFKNFASSNEICNDIKSIFKKSYGTKNEYDLSSDLEIPNLTLVICNNYSVLSQIYNALCESDVTIDQSLIYKGERSKYNSFRLAHQKILLTDDTNLAGINIPFLRNVLIVGFPPSKEWFYQECGRIGRSGENSNVVVYTIKKDFEEVVQKLPAKVLSEDSATLFEKPDNSINFSNAEFVSSFLIGYTDSRTAIQLLSEIFKCVHVSETALLGTVIGKMNPGERLRYDKALFLMYYCGIIEKWLFNEDNTYRFYINMNIDDGSVYFNRKTITKIKSQSGNDEILEHYLSKLSTSEDFNALFFNVANWISENGYFIRRQMFVNTIQLAFETSDMSDKDIEQNLAMYFSVGHTEINVVNQNVDFDENESYSLLTKKDEAAPSTNVQAVEEIFEKKDLSKVNMVSVPTATFDFTNSKIREDLVAWVKEISTSESILSKDFNISINHIEEYPIEEIAFLKVLIEREVEYKFNKNLLIVLSLIELIKDNGNNIHRTSFVLESMTDSEIKVYFRLLFDKLTFSQKIKIDNILLEKGKTKVYYKGFLGFIKKMFKI